MVPELRLGLYDPIQFLAFRHGARVHGRDHKKSRLSHFNVLEIGHLRGIVPGFEIEDFIMNKKILAVATAPLALVLATPAFAAEGDSPFQTLYDGVGMDTIQTVVTSGAALVLAITVTFVGIKVVRRLLNKA